jgi:hypothetical protein
VATAAMNVAHPFKGALDRLDSGTLLLSLDVLVEEKLLLAGYLLLL